MEAEFVFQPESWQQSSICYVAWSGVKGHFCFHIQYNLKLFFAPVKKDFRASD